MRGGRVYQIEKKFLIFNIRIEIDTKEGILKLYINNNKIIDIDVDIKVDGKRVI